MSYDVNKLTKLGHLKSLANKIKSDYATKAELAAIKVPEYSVAKQATAETGFLSTYYLTKDGAQVGEKINIPKDFLVNSADIKTVETADTPYEGAQVGDLYIDFVINSKSADDTASHVYLPVNELVDAYTGGNGIEVSAQNLISAKIDTANANGLGVTAAGFKLDVATASTAGAMSAADKAKLDGIAEGANNYTHPAHTVHESGLYKVTVDDQVMCLTLRLLPRPTSPAWASLLRTPPTPTLLPAALPPDDWRRQDQDGRHCRGRDQGRSQHHSRQHQD